MAQGLTRRIRVSLLTTIVVKLVVHLYKAIYKITLEFRVNLKRLRIIFTICSIY